MAGGTQVQLRGDGLSSFWKIRFPFFNLGLGFGSVSFHLFFTLKIRLTDILYTYVLCNVKKFNSINFKNTDFRLCIELPVQVKENKFSYSEIPMFERKRFAGKKKVNVIKDGFLILTEILKSFKYLI